MTNLNYLSEWTAEDSKEADKLGWNVYHCEGSDTIYQVQKNDNDNKFKDDYEAWLSFAQKKDIHVKALRFLKLHCEDEYNRIINLIT